MTDLLELKEKIKLIYSKYEAFIVPVAKFLLALITINTLNGRMGYMTRIDDMRIVLIASLACSFLPVGIIILIATLFSLMHMYALSMEVALVGLCMYLIMYLLFFRFSPKGSLVVVLTPLLFAMKIPYVIPIVAGLLCGPSSVVSVGCGVGVHYLLGTVIDSAPNIRTMGEGEGQILEKIRMLVESILGNKAMLVVIVAFGITIMVVYLIRRMPVNHSWTIAMIAGAMMNVIILLIGDLLYDVNLSVAGVLFGSLLALAVGKVVEFFRFCVDYGRTERVQFEDDEYYYYVKAVPKMTVQVSTRTVKKINSQRARGNPAEARSAAGRQTARPAGRGAAAEGAAGRRSISRQASYPRSRSDDQRKGRSLTIGNAENVEDYEEIMDEAMMDEMMPDMTDNPDENGDWQ